MPFIDLLFPALVLFALPVIALVWTSRLSRRIDTEMKAALQSHESDEIRALTVRVYALESELAKLRLRLKPDSSAPPVPRPTLEPAAAAAPEASQSEPAALRFDPEPPAPAPLDAAPAGDLAGRPVDANAPCELETNIGLAWINRIAAVTLILAAAFFFKYAVDNQWIGETGRIVLGVLAGFAALGCGELAWRRGHGVYAQGVTALGIAILYLSFYSAFAFYHLPLAPQSAAFVLMAMTSVLGAALAIRYDAAAISLLAMLGGFLTPILLSTGEDRPWVLFSYILLLDLGALAVERFKKWGHLAPLAMAGTAILYAAWFAGHFDAHKQAVALTFALVYYALFALVESEVLVVLAQFGGNTALLAIACAAGPGESWILSHGWMFVALAGAGVALGEWRRWLALTRAAAAIFWLSLVIWQAQFSNTAPSLVAPPAIAGFVLFLTYLVWQVARRRERPLAGGLAMMAGNAAAAFGVVYHQFDALYHGWMGLTAAAFAGVHLLAAAWIWNAGNEGEERDPAPVLLLLGIALSFLTLAVPIQFSAYRITMAWALEGAGLAWISRRANSVWLSHGAMLAFALALFRLIAWDAWIFSDGGQYSLIANARFATFAVMAGSAWLSVRWLHDREAALTAYAGGHVVLIWALIMEVLGQAERSAPADKVFSVGTVSVSVLIAAYGVSLIGAFLLGRFTVNRLLGLMLLGGVVLKLYISDVWVLDRIYRVIAFGVLGILLLLTSFLYSRYRAKIGQWLKDDAPSD